MSHAISKMSLRPATFLLFSLLVLLLIFTAMHGKWTILSWKSTSRLYSFEGKDFPMDLPVSLPLVQSVFEESEEFDIMGLNAKHAWSTIHPHGRGYVHLGPKHRLFAVSTFHQLHCLVAFHTVLSDPEDTLYSVGHIHHCLNYVRQMILCGADATLEPYDFMSRNFSDRPFGFTRQCRDSKALYDVVNNNHADWMAFLRANYSQNAANWWKEKWGNHGILPT